MSRSRSWVFTDFDVSDERRAHWLDLFERTGYVRFQLEKSPTTGKLHYQGECQFRVGTYALSWFKSHIDNQVHMEIRKDKNWDATSYCTKPESRVAGPWESGTRPKPRGRIATDSDSLSSLRARLCAHQQANCPLNLEPSIRFIDRKLAKITTASITDLLNSLDAQIEPRLGLSSKAEL